MSQHLPHVSSEVAAEIGRLSELLYPGINFGPSISQWDRYRCPEQIGSSALMDRLFGRDQRNRKNWVLLLAAVGLEYPPKLEMQSANSRLADDWPTDIGDVPKLVACPEPEAGLPVIPVTRTLYQWCPRCHMYLPMGTMQSFMVR